MSGASQREFSIQKDIIYPLTKAWPQLKYMALAFIVAWSDVLFGTNACLGASSTTADLQLFSVASTVGYSVLLLVVMLTPSRRVINFESVKSLTLMIGCIIGGVALARIGYFWQLTPLLLVGALVTGIGSSWVCLSCLNVYCYIYPRKVFTMLALTKALSVLLAAVIEVVSSDAQFVLLIVLPILTGVCLLFGGVSNQPDKHNVNVKGSTGLDSLKKEQRKALIALFVTSLILAFTAAVPHGHSLAFGGVDSPLESNALSGLVSAAVLIVIAAVFNLPISRNAGTYYRLLYGFIMVFIVLLLVSSVASDLLWLGIVGHTIYIIFDMFIMGLLACCVQGYNLSFAKVFGEGRLFFSLGTFVAWGIYPLLFIAVPEAYRGLIAAALIIALLLVILTVFRLSDFQILMETVFQRDERAKRKQTATENDGAQRELAIRQTKEGLSLTPREAQVFEMMIRGRSAAYIAEHLFISTSTVKTHVANIYAKAGVTSKSGLLDLVEKNIRSNAR